MSGSARGNVSEASAPEVAEAMDFDAGFQQGSDRGPEVRAVAEDGGFESEAFATTMNEIASDRNVCIKLEEALIPVNEVRQGACEILGLDPLYVANEGRFAVFVPAAQEDAALEVMKKLEVSQGAARVGEVEESPARTVVLQSRIGGNRVVDVLSGEQLPRIC